MKANIELTLNTHGQLIDIKLMPDFNPVDFVNQKISVKETLLHLIQRVLAGKENSFSKHISLNNCSPFAKKILDLLLQVPRGKVISYSALAKLAGQPGATRAVATVMANNPLPILFPCHRVVPKNRACGTYAGIKNSILKKRLLTLEGVCFEESGSIREESIYEA